jgi:hypothetical protein
MWLVCDRGASPSDRGQWFSALPATAPSSPWVENARRQGLKTTFALLCPRSPGLTPRSLHWLLNSGLLNKVDSSKELATLDRTMTYLAV